jgi:hypothetical protein
MTFTGNKNLRPENMLSRETIRILKDRASTEALIDVDRGAEN